MAHDNSVKPLRLVQPQLGSQTSLTGPGTPTAGPAAPNGCWIDRGAGVEWRQSSAGEYRGREADPCEVHSRLNTQEILALYDNELRVEFQDPDLRRESLPLVVRYIRANPGMGFIRYSRLNEINANDAIQEQMAYSAGRNLPFEWDVFANDKPSDLEERLLAHGFKPDLEPDDPGAVLVLDLQVTRPPL